MIISDSSSVNKVSQRWYFRFLIVRRRHAAMCTMFSRRRDVCHSTTQNCIEEVSHWMSANCLKLNADKTELLWAGSRHGPALLGSAGPSSQLGTETVVASDQVCVLGVTLTSDLCLDKHVASVCAACFYWLCQLRLVRRSHDAESAAHDAESAATLVHAL